MSLFDKIIISKDEETQRKRLSQALCGMDATRLTLSTIFLYMIPTAISKYVVDIMNLYVFGILAGLTGAFWGYVITNDANRRNEIMKKKPWYSYNEYSSLMVTLSNKAFYYMCAIFIEIGIICIFELY